MATKTFQTTAEIGDGKFVKMMRALSEWIEVNNHRTIHNENYNYTCPTTGLTVLAVKMDDGSVNVSVDVEPNN